MFTGLVQAMGRVREVRPTPAGVRLVIDPLRWAHRPEPGESISVSGVCLTAAGAAGELAFDVVRETLAKTTLGRLREQAPVNLEAACRADTLLGGHIVQGHVDGVGRIAEVRDDPADWRMVIEPAPGLMEFAAPKGSICIDGVSLTIARLKPDGGAGAPPSRIEIALIPTTLERTTLGLARAGDACNMEMDCIAKQVVHWVRNYAPGRAGGA